MKNYNIKGDWSKFKKAIYELYETLSFHFNKNSSIKMKKMGSKGLQQDTVSLLELYKGKHDSYKNFFKYNTSNLINKPEDSDFIKDLLKCFTDSKFSNEFITRINKIIL